MGGNADMAIETKYGYYEAAYAESAANIAELNAKLLELDPLICCTECATEGGFSYDDVDLWARPLADADQGHRAAAQDQGLPRSLREEGRRAPLLQHGHLSTLGLSKMERAVVQSRASATVKMPAPRRCPLKFPSPNAHPAPSEPPPRATLS